MTLAPQAQQANPGPQNIRRVSPREVAIKEAGQFLKFALNPKLSNEQALSLVAQVVNRLRRYEVSLPELCGEIQGRRR